METEVLRKFGTTIDDILLLFREEIFQYNEE